MIFKLVLICFLLRFDVRAQDRFRSSIRKIDGARYCDFSGSRKNYNAIDLLQCINELAADLVDRESDRSMDAKSLGNARQISFANLFANFFNEDTLLPHQTTSFPADTMSGNYQSNYPTISGGTFDLSPGFQLNLFDALSSISRHDDYKCVPRILCEMASGKLPGRSLGKQTSSLLEFLGKNTFTEWLAQIDVAGASPLLNFGRAMILGYSNRGNSLACYRAFPRCPRNPNELVYYLNNYNGGFFRLFNRLHPGKHRRFKGPRAGDYSRTGTEGRIIAGGSIQAHQPGEVGTKVHFPSYKRFRSGNEVVFPTQEDSNNDFVTDGITNYILKSEADSWQKDVAFFPQETSDERYSSFRFP